MNTPIFLSVLFLITFMFWTGLEAATSEIVAATHDRNLMARAVLANVLVVPALGLALAQIFELSPVLRTEFLLIAFLPGGFLALNFVKAARGNMPFTVGLVFLLNLAAIALMPLLLRWLHVVTGLSFPGARAFGLLLVLGLAPLLLGRWVRRGSQKIAQALSRPLNILSFLLFVAANIAAIHARNPAIGALDARAMAALILLVLGSWAVAWGLGGPDLATRKSLAIATSMRNVAIILLLYAGLPADSNIIGLVIAFSGLSVPMNLLFSLVLHWIGRPSGEVQPRTA